MSSRLSFQRNCLQSKDLKQRPSIQCGMYNVLTLPFKNSKLKTWIKCLHGHLINLNHKEEICEVAFTLYSFSESPSWCWVDLYDIYKCNKNFVRSDLHCVTLFTLNCYFLMLYLIMNYYFIAGASPAKSQPVVNPNHQLEPPTENVSKHHRPSKPVWLLALEIVTGTMVGSLFLVALLAAFQKCNKRSSIIIPWKKSGSQKDHTAVYISM